MNDQELFSAIESAALLRGEFTLRSGRKSRYYLDKYLFESQPAILRELGVRFARHVTPACYVACTVRRENSSPEALGELARYWHGRARGSVFGFVTGRRGRPEETLPPRERARVLETFTAERMVEGTLAVYREVLERKA